MLGYNRQNRLVIIIPCFNESQRIHKDAFIEFLRNNEECIIVFSNDGSTDNTLEVLTEIKTCFSDNVIIYNLESNKGKAEAIREAVLHCKTLDLEFNKIAYIDADLSVKLKECLKIAKKVKKDNFLAFGSRILKIDTRIQRKSFRHYTGRLLATITSNILKFPVYDTQCGCKVFTKKLAYEVFEDKFISKWLFDIELFLRIREAYSKEILIQRSKEVPLKSWLDTDGSKVKLNYFFKLCLDIYRINKRYNDKNKQKQLSSNSRYLSIFSKRFP
ncbi:glycosyltransferase [Seonamhaeicola marinus]|uniref:Glycosyltransferase n=1 Tax=Seonamhaeicola marinus TaxID=1912246 RepID=A0A5D0I791_9FLAO|nr:glycosyltransferase [Seonamhaeicola marinus]TYA78730.1 glycosyltransferase [Seonamhaeicola marinus]